jgi:hypothetical protein
VDGFATVGGEKRGKEAARGGLTVGPSDEDISARERSRQLTQCVRVDPTGHRAGERGSSTKSKATAGKSG